MIALFYKRKTIDGIKKLKRISISTLMILKEAEKHGVSWEKIKFTGLFKLQYKHNIKYFHAQIPSETTEFAYYCCKNKHLTNHIMEKANLSVNKGYLIKHHDDKSYCSKLFYDLDKPLVVKSTDDSQGKNVYLNIRTEQAYIKAIEIIRSYNGKREVDILVEEMFTGHEYRILASQKRILSVIERINANVIGDNKSTIKELIRIKNKDAIRKKIPTYQSILINNKVINFVQKQRLTLNSVLAKDQQVFLLPHSASNISQGGDTIDVTDNLHPSVTKIVHKIMKNIPGLSLAGIDFMTTDIHKEQTNDTYKIIEINASPSLDWNEYPLVGPRRRISYEILKIMFPQIK
jgi:glutamate--cysteine ligase